jgi:hypothetical protein
MPKRPVTCTYCLKNTQNTIFYLKILNKIYSRDIFEEYINLNIFCYLRLCGVIREQSFGSQSAAQIRANRGTNIEKISKSSVC